VKQGKLSRPAAIALVVGGDLVLLLLGWFLLVGPQRSQAASIAKSVKGAEAQILQAEAEAKAPPPVAPKQPEIKTAALYELAKAMPSTVDMPDLLLELDQVARAAGVTVGSIQPSPVQPGTGAYSTVPINVQFTGNYYTLTDLLYRLNSLVTVRDGGLDASGRLFAVQTVSLSRDSGSGALVATVVVDAYVYGTAGSSTPAPVPDASTSTTSTGSTSTTTTSSASPSADVAPSP